MFLILVDFNFRAIHSWIQFWQVVASFFPSVNDAAKISIAFKRSREKKCSLVWNKRAVKYHRRENGFWTSQPLQWVSMLLNLSFIFQSFVSLLPNRNFAVWFRNLRTFFWLPRAKNEIASSSKWCKSQNTWGRKTGSPLYVFAQWMHGNMGRGLRGPTWESQQTLAAI